MVDQRLGESGADLSALVRDYGDVDAEVRAARSDAAMFDFSFMARARLHGRGAVDCLNTFQPRALGRLAPGRIAYSLRTDEAGRVRTDLTTWRLADDTWEVFSGEPRDIRALSAMASHDVAIEDLSAASAILAVQGPRTPALMKALCGDAIDGIDYFASRQVSIDGVDCRVGRLGYSGEKGVELIFHRDHAERLWRRLCGHARPGGFAAVDRLRIEAGFLLFANECRLSVSAAELGLQRFAGGRASAPGVRLVCFRADHAPGAEPWRPGPNLRLPRRGEITITSACRAPNGAIGLGFVPAGEAGPGRTAFDNAARFGTVTQARRPLHDPEKRRPKGPWQ